MKGKRSVTSYLLSILLVVVYIYTIIHTIAVEEINNMTMGFLLIDGILVFLIIIKRSIICSLLLAISNFISLDIINVFNGFMNEEIESITFFLTMLKFAFYLAIFLDTWVEQGYRFLGGPKSSFFYTDDDYTPGNRK